MNAAEYSEMKDRAKGMSEEDKQIVIKTVSNEMLIQEVNKRLTTMTDKFNQVREILKVSDD